MSYVSIPNYQAKREKEKGVTPDRLKELGKAGWIVGPGESEKEFVHRIETQQIFSQKNLESINSHPKVMQFIIDKLHVCPSWIQVRYSNRGLNLWEGAASWITKSGNWIQLRDSFQKGGFLGYQKEEVILHEVIHSLRFAFEEPLFEEILAHMFAKKKWRRYFGPILPTPKQAYLFLFTLCFAFFIPIVPSVYLSWRIGRLIWSQWTFKKALKNIKRLFPTAPSYGIALRLTDTEMRLFAGQKEEKVRAYIYSSMQTLRWQQLQANFGAPFLQSDFH